MKKEVDILIWENGLANAIMQGMTKTAYNCLNLKNSVLLLILLLAFTVKSQDSLQTKLLVPGNFSNFTVDNLGNFYLVDEENSISKIAIDKQYNYVYDNNELGPITSIDATNPLKILVGHSEMQTIVVLDVTLRETSRLSVPDLSIIQDTLVFGLSTDNKIWIYDAFETQLIKVGEQSNIIEKTQRLVDVLGYIPEITSLTQDDNYIVLNAPADGLIILDVFGNYIKTMPFKNVGDFILLNGKVAYIKNGAFIAQSIAQAGRSNFGSLQAKEFVAVGEHLFLLNEDGVRQVIFPAKP